MKPTLIGLLIGIAIIIIEIAMWIFAHWFVLGPDWKESGQLDGDESESDIRLPRIDGDQ